MWLERDLQSHKQRKQTAQPGTRPRGAITRQNGREESPSARAHCHAPRANNDGQEQKTSKWPTRRKGAMDLF